MKVHGLKTWTQELFWFDNAVARHFPHNDNVWHEFNLSDEDIERKFVILPKSFNDRPADEYCLSIVGGTIQELGMDYIIVEDKISWDGCFLESYLDAGDILKFMYRRKRGWVWQ